MYDFFTKKRGQKNKIKLETSTTYIFFQNRKKTNFNDKLSVESAKINSTCYDRRCTAPVSGPDGCGVGAGRGHWREHQVPLTSLSQFSVSSVRVMTYNQ